MKYTINNKPYTLFDIKARCAELMGIEVKIKGDDKYPYLDKEQDEEYDPCESWNDTGPIIEKCFDELTSVSCPSTGNIEWHQLVLKHNCTKLEAACICYIEMNDVK